MICIEGTGSVGQKILAEVWCRQQVANLWGLPGKVAVLPPQGSATAKNVCTREIPHTLLQRLL